MNDEILDEDVIEKSVTTKAIIKSAFLLLPVFLTLFVVESVRYICWYTDAPLFAIYLALSIICSIIIITRDQL